MIRVRFAPSPTGYLHVGGARTALFNWLFARKTGGTFILRIEDTDQVRYDAESEVQLKKELQWLGLQWDEGPDVGGQYGPYTQSQRLPIYKEYVEELIKKEKAYYCFCTSERLEKLKETQREEKSFAGYDRHCRNISTSEAKARMESGESYVVRLKVPLEGETTFSDFIRGPITYPNSQLDDIVLYKSNGFPSYHLANVVDDHLMKISHVLRGDEWIPSAPKHILLYRAFGWEPPVFVHLPVILAPGGGKLSKRKGAASVGDFAEKGVLPEALANFLALLGWSPGDDLELMPNQLMVEKFSIERIHPKSCFFDEKKLEWMNKQYMLDYPNEKVLKYLTEGLSSLDISNENYSKEWLLSICQQMKSRVNRFEEIAAASEYFFKAPKEYDPKGVSKHFSKDGVLSILETVKQELLQLEVYTVESTDALFHQLPQKLGLEGMGALVHPVRLAVSGVTVGPGLFDLLYLLGQKEVGQRLDQAIRYIQRMTFKL